MPAPTFEQKVTIPAPPSPAVDRPRLSRLLGEAVALPVTVVHGPPGCGKTEAVAAWARTRAPRPLWATLDRTDRDPIRLAGTLQACVAPLLGHAPGRTPTTPEEAEAVLVELLARAARADEPMVVVLDDVVALRGSPASELLLSLLRYLPETVHVVVVAGGLAMLSLGRLRVAGRLAEVDRDDLALRLGETAALVAAVTAREVPEDAAAEVHALAEGHPSFVTAAAHALAAGDLDGAGWVDAAVADVVDALPPDQRRLVAEIAPVRTVTPALADAVTDRRGSAALLDELARETPLVVPVDPGEATFRLHPLARRALVGRLRRDDPERLAATRRAAAHWLQDHGDPRDAIEEWIAAGEHGTAWELVVRHHAETYFSGGQHLLEGWLDRLPPTGEADPRRAADRAVLLLLAGRADEAGRWADQIAVRPATGAEGSPDDLLGFVRSLVQHLWGDLDAALATGEGVDPDRVGLPYAHLGLASTRIEALAQRGRFDEARQALLDMAPWAPFTGPAAQVLVPGVHASLAGREGRLADALALAAEALGRARQLEGPEGPGTAWSHAAVGLALLEQGHVVGAVHALEAADAAARRAGLAHVVVRVATGRARARALQGRGAEAFDVLEAARRPLHVHPLPGLLLSWLDLAEARLHLRAGDAVEALTILDALDGPEAAAPDVVVLRAWAALAEGDRALAQDLLAADLGPRASLGARIEADLLRVRSVRDRTRARRHLARAVHRGSVDGYLTSFLEHREGVVPALHDLRAVEPSPYLTDLLFLLDAGEGARPVEALTERELAVLDALQSNRSIEMIAGDLDVSVNTLKTHVKAVYRKLDAGNRSDAVRRALVLRLIGPAAIGDEALSRGAGAR